MAKKSVEYLARFYSGGIVNDTPWRGTKVNSGPSYLDLDSLAQAARERGIVGRVANPILREIGIGESSQRRIVKELPE